MTSNTHGVVRDRLLAEHPAVREEYQRLKPLYEAIARRLQASRGEYPRRGATH